MFINLQPSASLVVRFRFHPNQPRASWSGFGLEFDGDVFEGAGGESESYDPRFDGKLWTNALLKSLSVSRPCVTAAHEVLIPCSVSCSQGVEHLFASVIFIPMQRLHSSLPKDMPATGASAI